MDSNEIQFLSKPPTRMSVFRECSWGRLMLIVTATYTIAGTYSLVRSEFVPNAYQDQYQLLHWIPRWRWQTWLIGFLVLMLFASWEGAYRALRKRFEYQLVLLARIADVEKARDTILLGPKFEGFAYRVFVGASNGKSMALVRATQSLFNALNMRNVS